MIAVFLHYLRRIARDRGLPVQSLAFFALALTVGIFAAGQDVNLNGIAWAFLLLASLLGLGDLLERDELDDMALAAKPLPALMLAKLLAHWSATTLPIALLAPIALGMNLMPGFLLGGLAFSSIGLLGAALTLGTRKSAALLALIVMPLCVSPLIFGANGGTAFLASFTCAALTLAPFASGAIIRMNVSSC